MVAEAHGQFLYVRRESGLFFFIFVCGSLEKHQIEQCILRSIAHKVTKYFMKVPQAVRSLLKREHAKQ
jgi:hypothetical protein